MVPPREEALDGEAVRDKDDVVGAIRALEPPEQRIHKNRHTIIDIRTRLALRKPIEEHPKLSALGMPGVVQFCRRNVAVLLLAQRRI